jgi:hypothetical protein
MLVPKLLDGTCEKNFTLQDKYGLAFGKLEIPADAEYIDNLSISSNFLLSDVNISEKNPNYGLATNVGKNCHIVVPKINGVCLKNYLEDDALPYLAFGQLEIPNNVNIIGGSAFCQHINLSGDLVIPDSVESIGDFAFFGCFGLNGKIKLGNKLSCIGNAAFQNCSNLSGTLIIPKNLQYINKTAFTGCDKITDIEVSNKNPYFGLATNVGKKCHILVPKINGVCIKDFSKDDLVYGLAFGHLQIPNYIEEIGSCAFLQQNNLIGDLIIPDSVKVIEDSAFA